jgi:hypothetical protein
MKRIFSHSVLALTAGLALRLYFVLKHPANNSGDTPLYEELAANWLQHHIYGMKVDDALTAVDLRMPGYPAFLALIYAITQRVGADARSYVMFAQVLVDLCACVATAALAGLLAKFCGAEDRAGRAFVAALWLAALCPFTANYVAAPMTEVFAGFFTAAALLVLVRLIREGFDVGGPRIGTVGPQSSHSEAILALLGGFLVGVGTLFRPETPLLLIVMWLVLAVIGWRQRRFWRWVQCCGFLLLGCLVPLAPWAIRNALTLHEVQFLAPKNSNLPGELVPYGFMAWEKTWLYRVSDNYFVPWKLNGDVINLEDIPARAFDSPQEKERVAVLLEQYNNDLTLSPQEDAVFDELARERTKRHPLRTYLWVPIARAFTIWFTPRIELLPFSGKLRPVREAWREDPVDFSVTVGFFVLNVLYVALALWGAWRLWRDGEGAKLAVALMVGYCVLRTAFLTTLETPEPRYVLVCFPIVLALAGQVFAGRKAELGAAAYTEKRSSSR